MSERTVNLAALVCVLACTSAHAEVPTPQVVAQPPSDIPLAPATDATFPQLTEVIAHTPPAIRAMTVDEKAAYGSLKAQIDKHADVNEWHALLPLALDLLSRQEATFGPRHPAIIPTLILLEQAYSELGRPREAVQSAKRTNTLQSTILGESHPDTLANQNTLVLDLIHAGAAAEAEPIARRTLGLRTQLLGEKHPDTLYSQHNLAFALNMMGKPAEAEPIDRKTVALMTEVFGETDKSTLTSLNNLVGDLRDLGRYEEALPFSRRLLEFRTQVLGEKHPEVLDAISDLTRSLKAVGQNREAEQLDRLALERSIAALGGSHPDTLRRYSWLASDLRVLLRDAEAEPLERRALELKLAVLGEEHPQTLHSMSRLALDMRTLGRFAEAEPLDRRVLALRTRLLGEAHEDTLTSLGNLASDLRQLGRFEEAEPLSRRALELKQQALGETHQVTLKAMYEHALDLSSLGRYAEAEVLDRKALALWTEHFGERYLHTLVTLSLLAGDLRGLGRYAEAETLERRALTLKIQVLTEKHPETRASLTSLAGDLSGLGRHLEAERLNRRSVELATQEMGEAHPETLAAMLALGGSLRDQGKLEQSEKLDRRVLQLSIGTLGERHPATLGAISALAGDMRAAKRYAEAEELDRRDLAISRELLGETHLSTLDALANVGLDLYRQKKYAAAEALFGQALQETGESLGQAHPSTVLLAHNLAFALLHQPNRAAEALPLARNSLQERWKRYSEQQTGSLREAAQGESDRDTLQVTQRLFADAAWAAGGASDPALRAEAFAALQGASAGSAARAIAEVAARRYAAGAGADALITERKTLGEQWAAAEKRMNAALGSGGANASLRTTHSDLETRITALDGEIASKAPQYSAIVNQPALSVAEAQGLLGADEAVLMVVPTSFGTHVMTLTAEGLEWHRADIDEDAVGEIVGKLRAQLDPSGQTRSTTLGSARASKGAAFDRTAAWKLYDALVAPVSASLAGKGHVYVAADGALASLPFGVMVTQEPAAGSDDSDPATLRAAPWLSDAHALLQIPSLQSLAWLRTYNDRPRQKANVSFAGFGDPLLGGTAMTRGSRGASLPATDAATLTGSGASDAGAPLMDPAALRKLARLPGTKSELEAMRQTLGAPEASLHMAAAMTESAIRSADLSRTRILHLATHGLTASESGARAEPGLVFTPPTQASNTDDGYLAASEVLALDLSSTEWVILSACNTAAPSGNPGEAGLSGLARAFFYAGAPSLLASHWPVDDAVAARLTVDTVRRAQGKGTSRAQALQGAMQAIRNDPAHPGWAHPAAWAPFTLVGEGR